VHFKIKSPIWILIYCTPFSKLQYMTTCTNAFLLWRY